MRVGRPSRCGNQVAIPIGAVDSDVDELAPGLFDVRAHSRVCRTTATLEDAGGGEDLGAVTDGGNRFGSFGEMAHDPYDALIEPNILGCPTPGNNQGIVIFSPNFVEVAFSAKLCPGFSV